MKDIIICTFHQILLRWSNQRVWAHLTEADKKWIRKVVRESQITGDISAEGRALGWILKKHGRRVRTVWSNTVTSLPVLHKSRYFWATRRLPECFKNESAPWRYLYTLRSITVRSWSSALSNAPFLRLMTQTGPHYVIIKIRLYLDKPILHHRQTCQLFYRHKFTPLQSPYAPYLNKYYITKTLFLCVILEEQKRFKHVAHPTVCKHWVARQRFPNSVNLPSFVTHLMSWHEKKRGAWSRISFSSITESNMENY